MEDKKEPQDNHRFEMETKNIGINGNKTFTDQFGRERELPRTGVIDKFVSSYEDEEKTGKRK